MLNRKNYPFIAFIAVRNGSKGLPNKNVMMLGNKSLYEIAIQKALNANCIHVTVSTDIPEILDRSFSSDVTVLKRAENLCKDDSSINDVIYDWSIGESSEVFPDNAIVALIQVTSPFSSSLDLKNAYQKFCNSDASLLKSVTVTDNKILKYGYLDGDNFLPISNVEYCFTNRQMLPRVVRPNGAFYIFELENFRKMGTLATDNIISFEMDSRSSLDIDNLSDFELAKSMFKDKEKSFT